MHAPSWIGLLVVVVLVFLLFGRPGRLSNLMEDVGKGIRGFRKGLTDPNEKKETDAAPQVTSERREGDRTGV
jgi:sec-independent protein translocase protein TatA